MSVAETALAPAIELRSPDGSTDWIHRPSLRTSISGTPRPVTFEPPKNHPVRPSASTRSYWLWLPAAGKYWVASSRRQDSAAAPPDGPPVAAVSAAHTATIPV